MVHGNEKPSSDVCSVCGTTIAANAPGGLCPKCLLAAANPAADAREVPDWIGCYRIVGLLAEGGMGTVYVARQTEPIRRQVALKIIKPGMDSREILARFDTERRALALMDHPHVAKVLDAGETEHGRPYFVMELVDGQPITEFCDRRQLPLRERLDLFRQVCGAIQHAHQKGIIHRDLKPSNILVGVDETSGRAVPKVIDFGVAKALGPELGNGTMFTVAGQLIGTPEYMSPEQAWLDSGDIDTRSDIYGLGVILYELLTGRTPLRAAELEKEGLEAILRAVREREAPRPSTRLAQLEDDTRTAVAAARSVPVAKLSQSIRGDLDWIVARSLEKERDRRYQSAGDFAEDIGRYLDHRAVMATPPSAIYLFRKFARRNKMLIGSAAAVLAVLVGGILATSWQAREARRQRDRAEQTRAAAENLVGVMLDDLNEKLSAIGRLDLMEDVSKAADNYFEQVPEEEIDPSTSLLQGRALLNRACVLEATGDRAAELTRAREAHAIARELLETRPDDPGALALFASSSSHLSQHQDSTGDKERIEALLALAKRLMAREDRRVIDYRIAARAELNAIRDRSDVSGRCRNAIAIAEEGLMAFPENESLLLAKASALYRLGRNETLLADRIQAMEAAVTTYREVASRNDSEHARWRRVLARVLQQSSWHLYTQGNRTQDLAMIQLAKTRQAEALAELERLVNLSPHDITLRQSLAIALHNHGKHLLLDGEGDEAIRLWERDIAQHEWIQEQSPGDIGSMTDCLYQMQLMARHLEDRGPDEQETAIALAKRTFSLLDAFPENKRRGLLLATDSYALLLRHLVEIRSASPALEFNPPADWHELLAGLEEKRGGSDLESPTDLTIHLLACEGLAADSLAAGDRSSCLRWLGEAESSLTPLARNQASHADAGRWKSVFGHVAKKLAGLYEQCGEPDRAAEVRRLAVPRG